jgi:membrane-associated phospholipid phosphatase
MPLPIRKRKLAALLLLTGLVFSAIVMLTMAEFHEEVGQPLLSRLDPIILQAIHTRDTPTLTRLAFTLTWIGSPVVLVPVVALAAILLWRAKLRRDAVVLLAAMAGGAVLDALLKLHFRRIRPDVQWAFVTEHSFSFPSGHSAGAVVLYGVVTYLLWEHLGRVWHRVTVTVVALLLIAGIGASRVYLGVHYPTDVAAGYLVGLMWLVPVIGTNEYLNRVGARRTDPQSV